MINSKDPELIRSAEHLKRAAEQLRRFNGLGFASFSEPAAQAVENLAAALHDEEELDGEDL